MAAKAVREWTPPPQASSRPGLMVYNSLLDEKVPFVPAAGPDSKSITWYTCGPTVYDSAHMGHARNYVTFDIIRRVLEDYFGYNCLFVMNVTDVDDKIIYRARRNHLLAEYMASGRSADEVRAFASKALQAAVDKQAKKVAEAEALVLAAQQEAGQDSSSSAARKVAELEGAVKNEAHKLSQVRDSVAALQAVDSAAGPSAVAEVAGDIMAEALDKELGGSVTDLGIYRAHGAKYEREFMEDMRSLGVRPPDVLTRVSEYIPEIVAYVQRIIANGMGYESNGSVYFDTANFRSCGHTYGKLKPWAVGSAALAAESEANFETSEKRSPTDFALWKASKAGEPYWDSPWGKGRPGWHIECSAMASSILGQRMDIHTGGEDLRFPHHDNELAQAEAYYHHDGCKQWVNYFLHSGHLEIEGLKMSKSLKNFITIREALKTFSARQLRLMFLLQPWNKSMMYGEQSKGEMRARESQLKNFFANVAAATRGIDQTSTTARWGEDELELSKSIAACQAAAHEAMCDNINTMGVMNQLSELIRHVNMYLAKKEKADAATRQAAPVQPLLLNKAAAYVSRILSIFGVIDAPADKPGFGDPGGEGSAAASSAAASYLDAFAAFRDEVRGMAKAKAEPKDILAACDRVRDSTLVDLGVRLEDKPDGKAVWKLDDPAALKAEQEERAAQARDAQRKKVQNALATKQRDKEKFEKLAAMPSVQQQLADKYSKFDDAGEPTHDKEGNELEGKAKDKARKDLEKAKKVVEPLTKRLAEDPSFLEKLAAEVEELTQQLAKLGAGP